MAESTHTFWHFPIMIAASLVLFFFIIRLVLRKEEFRNKWPLVAILSVVVIIAGMMIGKYGANFGLPWWIYYPIPMLLNVLLPPYLLKMNVKKTFFYIVLSFCAAPLIHIFFSTFGWKEYMPFWAIF